MGSETWEEHLIFDSPVTISQVLKSVSTFSEEISVKVAVNEDNVDISGDISKVISLNSSVVHKISSSDDKIILLIV